MRKETVRNQRCAGTKADFLLALFIGQSPETETACLASSGMKRSGIEVCTAGEWVATKEIKRLQRIKMIELWNVNKTYETGNKALRNINITVEDGEFVFIIGRSGSGKSTLLKLLLKEVEPTSGKIIVNDMNLGKMPRRYIPKYRRRLGMIFQDFRLLKDRNVYENVAFAQRVIGASARSIRESVPTMLTMVGLSSKYKFYPQQLSGGEQQRVAIARALINRPEILLADEPTGNLDGHNSMEIMKLLDEINKRGTTVIVVTHSHEIVDRMKRRVITMDRGTIVSDEKKGGYTHED